jgi:hypothetical protein
MRWSSKAWAHVSCPTCAVMLLSRAKRRLSTAQWLAEGDSLTDSGLTFNSIDLKAASRGRDYRTFAANCCNRATRQSKAWCVMTSFMS